MRNLFSLRNSIDIIAILIAAGAFLGVLQSFIIGKHYIIPTGFLLITVLFGNLARFGLQGRIWAKHVLFWIGFLLTSNAFMGLFFARRPREMLGDAFEWVIGALVLVLAYLVVQYARKNTLFSR